MIPFIWAPMISATASMLAADAAQRENRIRSEHKMERLRREYEQVVANHQEPGELLEGEFEVIDGQLWAGKD